MTTIEREGMPLVWVINPMRESVTIYAGDEPPITLNRDGMLTGGEVLPSFKIGVRDLFAG